MEKPGFFFPFNPEEPSFQMDSHDYLGETRFLS